MEQAFVESIKLEAVRRIVQDSQPDRILLFGSYARGDAGSDSDLDLLVVYNELPRSEKRSRAQHLYRLLWDLELPTDIIIANGEDVDSRNQIAGHIYQPALSEGVAIYERPD